ncbi:MAG: chemotaxis protein CheX [Lachnospira sp.]|jgi:hypothetical protein|nr:chemotaxis protein CheX [Lachnospira sp.]
MNNAMLGSYIAKSHNNGNFTDYELKVLRENNLDDMVATFIKLKNDRYTIQFQCIFKTLEYFVGDSFMLEQINAVNEYGGHFIGCQFMDGDENVFFGISGDDDALLELASIFAKEDFKDFDDTAYDSVCELINCINGLFATRLSNEKVEVVLRPPVFYGDAHIVSDKTFYIATFYMKGKKIDMIMSVSGKIHLESN